MVESDWFIHKLNVLKDDYLRRDKENHKMLAASYEGRAKEKEKYDELIRDLCRALERAQEVIVMLGEQSGNEELLKDAKTYANAIGGLTAELGPNPSTHYSENPVVQKYWESVSERARKGDK